MAITCTTVNGAVDLNNGTTYGLQGFSWENNRNQSWLEPRAATHPILAADDPKLMTITISLLVRGSSQSNLVTLVENIRNEFSIADNVIIWGLGGGSGTSRFQTRPSVIQPPDYTNSGSDVKLALAASQYMVTNWVFQVLADPYRANETRQPVI